MTENREFQLPFRVLVHQKKGLEHGRSVVKFVNDALGHDQSALKVWLGGEKAGAVWLGNPPYEKADLQKSDLPTREANDLVFELDDSNLKYPLLVYDEFAICSKHGIYANIRTEPTHYYAYFLCMAIIGELARMKMGQPFPDFQPRSASDWSRLIEGGLLTHTIDNSKTLLRNHPYGIRPLIDNIQKVLNDIREFYAHLNGPDEPDPNPDPSQLPIITLFLEQDPGGYDTTEEFRLCTSVHTLLTKNVRFLEPTLQQLAESDQRVVFTKKDTSWVPFTVGPRDIEIHIQFGELNDFERVILPAYATFVTIFAVLQKLTRPIDEKIGSADIEWGDCTPSSLYHLLQTPDVISELRRIMKFLSVNGILDYSAISEVEKLLQSVRSIYENEDAISNWVYEFVDSMVSRWESEGVGVPKGKRSELARFLSKLSQPDLGGMLSAFHAHGSNSLAIFERGPQDYPGVDWEERFQHFTSEDAPSPEKVKTEQTSKTANAHISKPQFHGGSKTSFSFSESETPVDALGYRRYANALADLITHPDTQTPITIGLAGKWGMGKTTLMRYIGERIDSQQKAKKGNDTASNFILAEFSPWKYSKAEEVWPSLYATVIDKVRETMNWREWQKHQIVIEGRWRYFGWRGLLAVGLVLLIWYLRAWDYGHLPEFFNPTFRKLVVLLIIIIPPLASLAQLTQSVSSAVLKKLKKTSFPLASPIQDEVFKCFDKILDSLGFEVVNTVLNGIGTEKEKEEEDVTGDRQEKEEEDVSEDRQGSEEEDVTEDSQESETDSGTKMIIFVDDLDRCQPKYVLQILESTKILLERKGFVFVLAMDAKVLRYAVGSHYDFMDRRLKGRARIGHDYLEKIIQIPFHLPPLTEEELLKLKRQLIGDRLFKPSVAVTPPPATTATSTKSPTVKVTGQEPPLSINPDPPDDKKPDNKSTKPPDEPPKLDHTLSMTLDESEDKALDDMIKSGLKPSPRLMKRIINVYFLCRHLYLIDQEVARTPPTILMKWIALSTVYPFEARDVSDSVRANRGGHRDLSKLIKGENGKKKSKDTKLFLKLMNDHIVDPGILQQFLDITDCFNIALD